jgi:glycosyltransferase involved in cell wall biosynthesis
VSVKNIKVLFLFDRYLNSTMNWAERWMQHIPDFKVIITAPEIIKNQYYKKEYTYWHSPYQFQFPENEWGLNIIQKYAGRLAGKLGWYQQFLLKKLKEEKPDFVHIHFGNVAANYLEVIQKSGVPLVVTFNGYDYDFALRKDPALKEKYLKMFEYASFFTVGGTLAVEKLKALGCPEEKIHIVRLAIDPLQVSFFKNEKKKNSLKLLQVATFTEKKGHLTTLEALRIAQKKHPDISLVLMGEPANQALVEKIEDFIVKHNINGVTLILEVLPYEELVQSFKDYDVFIHPSETPPSGDCEGTPVTIMDAQLSGMPVLSTIHADIPDIVKDKKTGFLVHERDASKLADGIISFYEMETATFLEFQTEARKQVETNFNAVQSGRQLRTLYENSGSHA